MITQREYDYFKYRIVSWRGAVVPVVERNLTYDSFKNMINSLATNEYMREFWVAIQSDLDNDMHIPLLDFDIGDSKMASSVRKATLYARIYGKVSKYFGDCGAFIFSTSKGFHVVPNKLMTKDEYTVLLDQIGCCTGYVNCFKHKGFTSLRIGCKELRPSDIRFAGFMSSEVLPMGMGYDIDPTVYAYIKIHEELAKKMNSVYIYEGTAPIYPKFIDDDNTKGFDVDANGIIKKRMVNPDDFNYLDDY